MTYHQLFRGKKVPSVLWLPALLGLGMSGWACSSSSGNDAGFTTGGAGNSHESGGVASADGGRAATGSTSSTGKGGAAGPGAGGSSATAGTTSGNAACDNGIDDDGDGLIDGFDPECTGPLDDDEGTFATGIPGDNKDPKWQDCFFDGNSGAGDDNCRYATGCLTGELPLTDRDCVVTDACIKYCAPLTQNGCDCFGCCTVRLPDGSTLDVSESATCSVANVGDEKACPRCVKSTQCGNECDECELCAGKTLADLPAPCAPTGTGGAPSMGGAPGLGGAPNTGGAGGATGGVSNTCGNGEAVCGPGREPCSASEYCSFGCCIPAIR